MALAALAALAATPALLLPFADRDSWRIWALQGVTFAVEGGTAPVRAAYSYLAAHPHGLPLTYAASYLAAGGIDERLARASLPLWLLAGCVLLYSAAGAWSGERAAAAWAALLATTPIALDHAALGNADLPLAVSVLGAALCLCRWLDGERTALAPAIALMAFSAWLKRDGLYLGALLLLLALALQGPERRSVRFWLGVAATVACSALALISEPRGIGGLLLTLSPQEPLASIRALTAVVLLGDGNSARGALGGYGALWLIWLGVAGWNFKGWRRDRSAVLLNLGVCGGLLIVGVFLAYTPEAAPSADRYCLHVAPLAVAAAARSLSSHAD